MRFTSDGLAFAATTSPGCAAQIATWLRPGAAKCVPQGAWTMSGDEAVFTLAYEIATPPRTLRTRLHHRASSSDDWATMFVRCDIESSDRTYDGKSWQDTFTFVPVEERCLDGLVAPRSFRSISSVKSLAKFGVSAEAIAEIQRTRAATLARLNALERDELVSLGLTEATADAIVNARVAPAASKRRAK